MITGISSQAGMLALLCANHNVISIISKCFPNSMAMALALELRKKRKRLVLKMRTKKVFFSDSDSYILFRTKYDEMKEIAPILEKIRDYKIPNSVFVSNYFLRELREASNALLEYKEWLYAPLEPLNKEFYKTLEGWRTVLENELWENHNKAYTYWM